MARTNTSALRAVPLLWAIARHWNSMPPLHGER